ncbi:MAG: M48 family metalloprotease [Candidatus Aenigmarchaeota archaeon]|nr:M48 family metalloprotease [Candidatus Aenigmarchaeota archaeon]
MVLGKLRLAMFVTFVVLFGTVLALTGIVVWLIAPGLYAASAFALIAVLLGFAIGITLLQYLLAPYIIRTFTNMKPLPEEYKWIHDYADELTKKAGLKKKPKLYLVHDGTPNAFAFGYGKGHAHIALHTGLVEMLNKDEIKSVLAHEFGHVKHNDMVLITIASMVPVFVFYLIVAIGSIVGRSRDDDSGLSAIFIFIGAYVAQFFTYLIVLYLSRTREYYADAFSAAATSGKDMRTALAKIAYGFPAVRNAKKYEMARSFYIADPIALTGEREQREKDLSKDLEASIRKREKERRHVDAEKEMSDAMKWERERAAAKMLNVFSTHPLTYKRIDALFDFEKTSKGIDPLKV